MGENIKDQNETYECKFTYKRIDYNLDHTPEPKSNLM